MRKAKDRSEMMVIRKIVLAHFEQCTVFLRVCVDMFLRLLHLASAEEEQACVLLRKHRVF